MMWNQAKEYIKLEAMLLAEGDNTREIECPFCPAADKEKGSLSVSRTTDGLLYQCYRAKCGAHGHIPTSHNGIITSIRKKKNVNQFDYEVSKLTNEQYSRLIVNYNLTVDEIDSNGLRWVSETSKLAIPLFDANYLQWGWEAKKIKGLSNFKDTSKKSIAYTTVENPVRLHYPKLSKEYIEERTALDNSTIVLVEDVISAIRVMRYVDSVALLGHSLGIAQVLALLEGYKDVIVALDPDATDKAIKMKREYGGYFNTFEVKPLKKDPKNMTEDELEREFLAV